MDCCTTWDKNYLVLENSLVHVRLDGYPVVPGHMLVIPKRHVESFTELSYDEAIEVMVVIRQIKESSSTKSFTIAINDGPLAGRTVPHLHIHVIPRHESDVPDPRGGVRQLFYQGNDPWIQKMESA